MLLNIRITEQERKYLKEEALKRNLTVTALIKVALYEYLNK